MIVLLIVSTNGTGIKSIGKIEEICIEENVMLRKDLKKNINLKSSSVDPEEIIKFNKFADEWWNPNGAFKTVHAFNQVRVEYILNRLSVLFQRNPNTPQPLNGLKIIDVGCGAGIVTEPLSNYGADILGIDAAERNIEVAKRHAQKSGASVRYFHALPEDCIEQFGTFDVVLSLEVVEHVVNLEDFLQSLANLVRPGGFLIIGTLNRTLRSYLKAIIGAEYILGWLPRGTHNWSKFVTPAELDQYLCPRGFCIQENCGVALNPLTLRWGINNDISTNYLQIHFKD